MQEQETYNEVENQVDEDSGMSLKVATAILARVVELNAQRKEAKDALSAIETIYDEAKEQAKEVFIAMGVKAMKALGKTVYIQKDIRASLRADADRIVLTEALIASDMANFITCNAQQASSYVKEIAREHPECLDTDGNITADPEMILSLLPEPFNQMFRVSETFDIRVRAK